MPLGGPQEGPWRESCPCGPRALERVRRVPESPQGHLPGNAPMTGVAGLL